MIDRIKRLIEASVSNGPVIEVEIPKNDKWGDFSTNVAIILSKKTGANPKDVADNIVCSLRSKDQDHILESISSTAQGFINFKISKKILEQNTREAIKKKDKYGNSDQGKRKSVLLEFVSANPTGPLHIGHGRWAVIGDCLASLLRATGQKVTTEFYVNDAGEQIEKLINSIIARMQGNLPPEGGYAGEYISDIASHFDDKMGRLIIKAKTLKLILEQQQATLKAMRITFNNWFYESELHKKKLILAVVKALEVKGLTFKEGNALWFKSSDYGDDKNRVLIKDDGAATYFAADIAYHLNKLKRGFNQLINVWGTDHHGYVARLRAAITALGYPAEKLVIIIGQLVALYRGKELIRMSKRTGEMITLQEVIDEIGVDATRYFLAKNSPNTHLDFDLELAKKKSLENPVYYVSYAHARIRSIIREAKTKGFKPNVRSNLGLLTAEEERALMLKLLRYEDEVIIAANNLQPHRLTAYAEELASIFHNYYHKYRVISDNKDISNARLTLVLATSIVLKNVLKLLGIDAPDHM